MHAINRLGRLSMLFVAGLALAGAQSPETPAAPPAPSGPQEVEVMGVFVDPQAQQPVVVLQGKRDHRSFAMVIGPAEATGIAVPLQKITPPRPLTHDLFLTLFGRLGVKVEKVVITDLRDNTFFAVIYLNAQGLNAQGLDAQGPNAPGPMQLDSRPSDAIALAVRAKAPVYVEDRVFDKASQVPGALPPGSRI